MSTSKPKDIHMSEPEDADFFRLFSGGVETGVNLVRQLERKSILIGSHVGFRKATFLGQPFPSFINTGLKNYSQPFALGGSLVFECRKYEAFRDLVEYALGNTRIRNHFAKVDTGDKVVELNQDAVEDTLIQLVGSTVDMCMHKRFENEFSLDWFKPYYREIERGIFDRELEVQIHVPILAVDFKFESERLTDDVAIFRMGPEAHEARSYEQELDPRVHWLVARHASHAFLLNNKRIENKGYRNTDAEAFKLIESESDNIDRLFGLLRMATGVQTGFAQILVTPLMWSFGYLAYLPPFLRYVARSYPREFDEGIWLRSSPKVSSGDLEPLRKLISDADLSKHRRLRLAISRLSACLLRETEDDRILDAAIGLEALFGDTDKQEMTHKLAMRTAAVSSLSGQSTFHALDVFRAVKTIYKYRSDVAHGSSARKNIKLVIDGKEYQTVDLAIELLRKAIMTLAANPAYLEPDIIDKALLQSVESAD